MFDFGSLRRDICRQNRRAMQAEVSNVSTYNIGFYAFGIGHLADGAEYAVLQMVAHGQCDKRLQIYKIIAELAALLSCCG